MLTSKERIHLQVRKYLPKGFKVTSWEKLESILKELAHRRISNVRELERWILDRSEVDAAVTEHFGWKYINFTKDTKDTNAADAYKYYITEIAPNVSIYEHQLNMKLISSSSLPNLYDQRYSIYVRNICSKVKLYDDKNTELEPKINLGIKAYKNIFAKFTVKIEGQEYTLKQANKELESNDRTHREQVYRKMHETIEQDRADLDDIFDDMVKCRHQMALHAGLNDYRTFRFKELQRFDYSIDDCLDFHESIRIEILPIVSQMYERRKNILGVEHLRPWDLNVDILGEPPLQPFRDTDDLIDKSIETLSKLKGFFGDCLRMMRQKGHLDLEIRAGKHGGAYQMPLMETKIPYIFRNVTQSISDVRGVLHESGHAIHSFLMKDYKLVSSKLVPAETAELAAMTMELLAMEHWGAFFNNSNELCRAKIWLLENILKLLPWIAIIDKFQHWIYTHPEHTQEERYETWLNINKAFTPSVVDYQGVENELKLSWFRQVHIFEVPFYYIEYGMAQLGAISIWKNYRENREQTIEQFIEALKLGNSKSIREVYQRAGIKFNFSRTYVHDIARFLQEELSKLYATLQSESV